MKENRYNVFNQIHKGLRALLYDTALGIQQTDFEEDAAAKTVRAVELVVDLFDEHAHHEDTCLLPMLVKVNPELVAEFENEHVIDHQLSDNLREQIKGWRRAGLCGERVAYGKAIFYAFNEFIAFNLHHMNKEENILLYTLWKHYTDEDLQAAQQAIIASITPETMMVESRWMMRALSNGEILQWLGEVKQGAPAEVFDMFLGMAEEELAPARWEVVSNSFSANELCV